MDLERLENFYYPIAENDYNILAGGTAMVVMPH